jgi:deoxyadenosine/deoxycytidine kinase
MQYNYIAIEGNIGAGKTSLARRLAEDYNGLLILERFKDNSFLPKFYKDPKKYAFPLEMSFLADRYQQVKDQLISGDLFSSHVIADYIIDKSRIFASVNLERDELILFNRLFDIIYPTLAKPELVVYLHLPVEKVQNNIRKRGRDYEQDITDEYLLSLEKRYLSYLTKHQGLRVLILDTSSIDFVCNKRDYNAIKELIEQEYPIGVHRISEF